MEISELFPRNLSGFNIELFTSNVQKIAYEQRIYIVCNI